MGHGEDHRRRAGPAARPGVQHLTSRLAEVDPERLDGWVTRFEASHGPVGVRTAGAGLGLEAADGARADLEALWQAPGPVATLLDLAAWAAAPRTAAVLLVRRGGWAAGLVREGRVLDAAGGTRYVQSRTAAGGWSQQRYARRRAGQADALVEAASSGAAQVARRAPDAPDVLAVGGDRGLVDAVLAGPGTGAWARLPRSPLLDVPDPRRSVVEAVALRVRRVRVTVTDP